MSNPFDDAEIIASYSRAQALEEGQLVDVTERARELGFKCPVAFTRAVFDAYVAVPEGVRFQDESGRLHDILWMLFVAACRAGKEASELSFAVCVQNTNDEGEPPEVALKSVAGPGDAGELVITVMLPEES